MDVKEALERVGNDKELLIELFGMLEENLNEILPKLEAAIERSSAEEARSLSHRLKGSAANLSALALRQSASQIEQLAKQSDWAGIRSAMPGLHAESERFKAFRKTYS
ncbi:MAG: Hpt domain-containing protein [Candidatus Sumerlaeota bacterium]|nr:Hpt domain-containing protein [Candidatus Sumerlaeota bacterium]